MPIWQHYITTVSAVPDYRISTDPGQLDIPLIHRFLSQESYWARDIPLSVVQRSIAGSLCFGLYADDRQIGFARVVTDAATFGYLADVFILPSHRRLGLARRLMAAVMAHPQVQGLRRFMLATRDAQDLYRGFGFAPPKNPQVLMERHNPQIYQAPPQGS
jgi:GNAT superfamily N-acetyltransferase